MRKIKTVKELLILVLIVGTLTCCGKKEEKSQGVKSPDVEETPTAAKSSDIEVRATAIPVESVIEGHFRKIQYQGTAVNTGFSIAPTVKVEITWTAQVMNYQGRMVPCQARGEEILQNLRPGETREFLGEMQLAGVDFPPFMTEFQRGDLTYDVAVLP